MIYINNSGKNIVFIDYENYIDQFPATNTRGLKRSDFIVYPFNGKDFFIINELSQGSSTSKLSDAKKQLQGTLLHLCSSCHTKQFIDNFIRKECIYSNKSNIISSPNGIADSFNLASIYIKPPIKHNLQLIEKFGFIMLETDTIDI